MSPSLPDEMAIGVAAEATGLSVETLRMWERRYGHPQAVRRPSGHRRYLRAEVLRIRKVAELVALGHRPSQVVALEEAALDGLLRDTQVARGLAPTPDLGLDGVIQSILDLDGHGLLAWLEEAFRARSSLAFLERAVAPLMVEIGRRWADGGLEVRHEHFASGLIQDFLSSRRHRFRPEPDAPRIVLAGLSGEQHGLGIEMAAYVAATRGCQIRVLGVDTPRDEVAMAAREWGADTVGISVSVANAGPEMDRRLGELRRRLPEDVALVVGGCGARGARRGPSGITWCERLEDWDRWLSDRQSTLRSQA